MYATRVDMVDRFGEREVIALTDRDLVGTVDEAVLARAIETAQAEVDGYLAGRYRVPLDPPPKILCGLTCDIARYRLCGGATQTTDEIRDRYRDAVRVLEHAAAGRVLLAGLPAGGTAATSPAVQINGGRRLFGRSGSDW